MQSYFIADRKVTDLTMIVTVGGAPTTQGCVVSHRPLAAFNQIDVDAIKFIPVSDKKLDGIIHRQTGPKRFKSDIVYFEPTFPTKELRRKNNQVFCARKTQFILRNIGPEISYSTAKEVLGAPTRKGKLLVWPNASFEQEVVMAAIDQCHDRTNGNIYNGIITIGHQTIYVAYYLRGPIEPLTVKSLILQNHVR